MNEKLNNTVKTICDNISQNCVMVRTRKLSRTLTRIYNKALRPFNIKSTQYSILIAIGTQKKISPKEIGNALSIEKSTLSRSLKNLQQSGLINIRNINKQQTYLSLTTKAKKLLNDSYYEWQRAQIEAKNELQNFQNEITNLIND